MASTDETTAAHATETARLRRSRPQLIGTFGATEAMGALLRLPEGTIERLTVGDISAAGTVIAIEPGAIHIARGGRTEVLRLPLS
ncbi:MAG: amidophosphoribosyltransferase [Pseudomonadota bacterium]